MHRTEGNSQPRSTALSGQQERLKETFMYLYYYYFVYILSGNQPISTVKRERVALNTLLPFSYIIYRPRINLNKEY